VLENSVLYIFIFIHHNGSTVQYKKYLYCRVDCCLATLHSAALGVWPGGWVSVTFVYCVETAKDTAIVTVEYE